MAEAGAREKQTLRETEVDCRSAADVSSPSRIPTRVKNQTPKQRNRFAVNEEEQPNKENEKPIVDKQAVKEPGKIDGSPKADASPTRIPTLIKTPVGKEKKAPVVDKGCARESQDYPYHVLSTEEILEHLMNNSFENNRLLRWCAAGDCKKVIGVQYIDSKPVNCSCGYTFCFCCGRKPHEPLHCNLLQNWTDKLETGCWISANTDQPIDVRNGVPPVPRYVFFYNRYMNVVNSLPLGELLQDIVKKGIEERNVPYDQVKMVNEAFHILRQCREALMNTYIFTFFLKKNKSSTKIQEMQHNLEWNTGLLSDFLEMDLTIVDSLVTPEVHSQCCKCDDKRRRLLNYVQHGYDNNSWVYTEEARCIKKRD